MPQIPAFLARSEDRYAWRVVGAPDPVHISELEILFGPEEPADVELRLDAITVEEG